jgi:hypothetical protein
MSIVDAHGRMAEYSGGEERERYYWKIQWKR